MISIIQKTSLFTGLHEKAYEEIIDLGYHKKLNISDIVFYQEDPARTLFLILKGRLRLVCLNENGEEVILRFIGPGEITAAASVLSNLPYPASAHVVQEGEVFCWNGNVLREAMQKYPQIALNALNVVAARLVEVQERFLELRSERVEQRIARTLLRLLKRGGKKVKTGVQIDYPLSRKDIAEYSGTTLYTVSRTISNWEKLGWVTSGREKIIISNLHSLVSISEDLK